MLTGDNETIFEASLAKSHYNDLSNSPAINNCTYDMESSNAAESLEIVSVQVITQMEDDLLDIPLEPSTEVCISTGESAFSEEHNYAIKDVNDQVHAADIELTLLMQKRFSHKCDLCNKIFATHTSLQRHTRSHTKEKPYQCKVCDKHFSQQSNLWKHIRIHTGERPFECPQCKRKFSQRANMKKHLMIHSGEKPYECPHCWRSFTQLVNLNKHMLLHLGTQPYRCKYCDKGFFQRSNMRKHEYVHEGIKPYSCSLCRVSYTQHSNLKKHLAVHKSKKPYVCEECGKSFTKEESLNKHQKYCSEEVLDSVTSLLDFETNQFIKVIQTDDNQQIYYISDDALANLEHNDELQ